MSRAVVLPGLASERKRAAEWCMSAKPGTIVEFKESKRTTGATMAFRFFVQESPTARRFYDERQLKVNVPRETSTEDTP